MNEDQHRLTQLNAKKKDIEAKLAGFKMPERRYSINDATTEKIGEIASNNPNGILLERDELAGWLMAMDKSGREGDREFYLEAWNGKNGYCYDRIGRGTIVIPALCLTIVGGIQPGKFAKYVSASLSNGKGDDGFLQRFQLMVYPDFAEKPKIVDRAPNVVARNRVANIMLYLDSRTRSASSQTEENIEEGSSPEPDETHGAPIYGLGDSIPRIKFSQEAQPIFNAWLASIEDELFIMKEESEAFEAHLSKFRKLVPTLALIFEGIKTADSRKDILEVSKESLDLAISWAAFLREHAVRVYAISNNPSLRGAHALLTKIKAGQIKDGTSLRKIYRHHWMHLKDRDAVDAAASFLEDINMVKIDTVKVDQTTTDILRINPQVYQS